MKNYVLNVVAGLICFVAGLGLQVNVDREYIVTLGAKAGDPFVMEVKPGGQKYRASWQLIQYHDTYKTKTGASVQPILGF